MSEISNMFLPNEEIFETLKAYVEGKSTYEVWVGRNKVKEQNNVVVFEETNNLLQSYSTTFDDTTRALSYNIEVYCNKNEDNYDAIKQISILILEVICAFVLSPVVCTLSAFVLPVGAFASEPIFSIAIG